MTVCSASYLTALISLFLLHSRGTNLVPLYFKCNGHVWHTRTWHCFQTLCLQCFSAWQFSLILLKIFVVWEKKISLTDTDYSHWTGNAIKRMAEIQTINAAPLKENFTALYVPARPMQNLLLHLLKLSMPEEPSFFPCPFSEKVSV